MSRLYVIPIATAAVAATVALSPCATAFAGSVKWHEAKTVNGSGVNALTCPSTGLCVAAGYKTVAVSRDPTGSKSTWKRYSIDHTTTNGTENIITAAGCVSAHACVVGDSGQNGWFSSDPQSANWDAFGFPYEEYVTVEALGCSPLGNCTALSVDDHAMSTSQLSATSHWSFVQLPGTSSKSGYTTSIAAVSCPDHTCAIADSSDDVYVTSDAGATWKAVHIAGAHEIQSVDCTSAHFCIAGAFEGSKHVWISRDPASASSWHVIKKFDGSSMGDESVGCASASRCVVGTSEDAVYSSKNPTKSSSWKRDSVPGGAAQFNSISCPSTSLCGANDQFGDIYTARF